MFEEITRENCILSILWSGLSLRTQAFKMCMVTSVSLTKVQFVMSCEMEKQLGKTLFLL